jgi:coenzyme PQQ precursor peptide PqqA
MVGTCNTSTLTPPQEQNIYTRGSRFVLHNFKSLGDSTINILSPEGASMLRIPQDNPIKINIYKRIHTMWKTPVVKEVAVGLEINCYACAEI